MKRTTILVNRTARLPILLTIGLILLVAVTIYTSGSLVASAKGSITKGPSDPYSANGKLILTNALRNTTSGWQLDPPPHGCQFIKGGYQMTAPDDGGLTSCHYSSLQTSNLTMEVQMRITKGEQTSCAGIVLRDEISAGHAYAFLGCLSGSYQFIRVDNFGCNLLQSGSAPTMRTTLNQPNLMVAEANGSTLNFYINHQKVMSIDDSKYTQGQFGVVGYYETAATFTNAKVWQL
ncbi:MAG TPA: hypothetical protein VK553_08740 [Candidatus Nitrosopolaris rasttigaisensis]|nr:hypothetical protein [Candidatus Nitrosopolaris rasttigaisensis]